MKLRIAAVFIVLFCVGIFLIFSLKDYFFLQKPSVNSKTQKIISQNLVKTIVDQPTAFSDFKNKSIDLNFILDLSQQNDVNRIFHFWASWCDPCANELPELIQFSNELDFKKKKDNVLKPDSKFKTQIYLISLDSDFESLNKFTKVFPEISSNKFIQIWDKDSLLSKLYSVDKLPMSIIFYRGGKVEVRDGVVNWEDFSFNE